MALFFCTFHALSFELNFLRCPLKAVIIEMQDLKMVDGNFSFASANDDGDRFRTNVFLNLKLLKPAN